MPFWDSGLDPDERAHGPQAVVALLDVLDDDLDRVRDLLEGPPQHLLADELGQQHVQRLVRALLRRKRKGPSGIAPARWSASAADARGRCARDREDLVAGLRAPRAACSDRRGPRRGRGGRPC